MDWAEFLKKGQEVNILVCMKQVADTEATIKISATQKEVEESGVKFIINPYDEFAIEEALKIKEASGGGTVKALCLGPSRATEALRMALAMGVDEALLLKSEQTMMDSVLATRILADAIQKEKWDLILLGKETIDDGREEWGPLIAEWLQWACITLATKIALQSNDVTVEREGESGLEVWTTALPAVITCQKGLNEPRYPTIRGVMMAKKKEISQQPIELGPGRVEVLDYAYPPSRKAGRIVGEGVSAVPELVRLLHQEAKVL